MTKILKAPFPWFGGKSRCAEDVWQRFGPVSNCVEPFFGSGAVLLNRPNEHRDEHGQFSIETINDKDGYVSNFWRALKLAPDAVAEHADWPVSENDLHARHSWLLARKEDLTRRLEGDPDYFDAKIAGWWVWGIACWIGGGFCSGEGPWRVIEGELVNVKNGDAGQGVNRKLVHLGDAGRGVNRKREELQSYFAALAARLANVRVCSGDWERICGPTPTFKQGLTGVFLDPPYSAEADRADVYTCEDLTVAHAVREWAIANGDNPLLRIALCGYEGEHAMPENWECFAWKATGGYGSQSQEHDNPNTKRERIWFSPHCLKLNRRIQTSLFDESPTSTPNLELAWEGEVCEGGGAYKADQ